MRIDTSSRSAKYTSQLKNRDSRDSKEEGPKKKKQQERVERETEKR